MTPDEHALALSNLARVLGWAGKHDEALRLAERAVAQVPDHFEALFMASAKAFRIGRLELAIDYGERAVAVDPDDANARNNLANALSQADRHAEAIEHLRTAIRRRPELAVLHENLGHALREVGSFDAAASAYDEALRLEPTARAFAGRGRARLALARLSDAAADFERSLELEETAADVHLELARALYELDRHPQALQHHRRAADLAPAWPPALNALAEWLACHPLDPLRDGSEALQVAERAVAVLGERHLRTALVHAAALAELGRFDAALARAQAALEGAGERAAKKRLEALADSIELYRRREPRRWGAHRDRPSAGQ